MKYLVENKKALIVLIIIIIALLLSVLLIHNPKKSDNRSNKTISIDYGQGETINLFNIKHGIIYKNSIVVTNSTNKDMHYSISWKDVSNSFKEQNKLLYEINTHDSDALFLSKSQLPIADFTLNNEIIIRKNTKHTYEVIITFDGDEQIEENSSFIGTLKIKQEDK